MIKLKKVLSLGLIVALATTGLVACNKDDEKLAAEDKPGLETNKEESPEAEEKTEENKKEEVGEMEQLKKPVAGEEIAVIKTNKGDIKVRLFKDAAPKTVENFVTHAKNGYYDGVIFHRVIKDFMIQGGDPQGTGMGGESIWGDSFEDEFNLDYRNITGALSMANAGPNTNGSQFFIVNTPAVDKSVTADMRELGEEAGYPDKVVDAYEELGGAFWLDMKHTVFGQVFEGMDVVEEISNTAVQNDRPKEDIIIETIIVEEHK